MTSCQIRAPAAPPFPPGWAIAGLLAVCAWYLGTHFLHVFSEVINWDEFALLERADRTVRFGQVEGGSRPGLVSIFLIPFVKDCVDSVRSVVNARLLWQLFTLAYLFGAYALVRRWFIHAGHPHEGRVEGVLAVALLAFIPAFVTWSVQVRTDQPALAAVTWGGVLLLSPSYVGAVAAGTLIGAGLLCTQKALYVAVLCGTLFVTATAARMTAPSAARREARQALGRSALALVFALLVVAIYAYLVPSAARLASGSGIASTAESMNWYRQSQGYRIYTVHAYRLVVHWVLFAMLALWTARVVLRKDRSQYAVLATSWLVLLLGALVVRVHGSNFPYFWMTVGLFLSVGLSMAAGRPLAHAGRMTWVVVVSLVLLAALQSAQESIDMLYDTQWEQRETIRLVNESNLRNRRGYQVEGALFCSHDPDPLPAMFSQTIWRRFKDSPAAVSEFIDEFRSRPVAYIVESYRMSQFPNEIQEFWGQHYVWYGRSLFVAGTRVNPAAEPAEVEIIVPGKYRWVPDAAFPTTTIVVGSTTLQPLDTVFLRAGAYRIAVVEGSHAGSLMLADLPPMYRDAYPAFYHRRQILQLGGRL